MPRSHLPGQRSRLWVLDLETGERRIVTEQETLLIEAPNWSPDGRDLVHLFGGQGTINVPSWAPDSRALAYVDDPLA